LRTLLPVLSQRLIKAGYAIRINSLSWPELEYGYPKFKAVLEQQLHEMKKS
jgi:exonuclease I